MEGKGEKITRGNGASLRDGGRGEEERGVGCRVGGTIREDNKGRGGRGEHAGARGEGVREGCEV